MNFPFLGNTASVEETEQIGAELGRYITENGIRDLFIALYGDLGAGKTAFVRGLASSITPNAFVCSPTYTVVNEYIDGKRRLCHFDMYRIEGEDDLYSIGFYDYSDCIIAVEWCEKIPFALPSDYLRVDIVKTENGRKITIKEMNPNADSCT